MADYYKEASYGKLAITGRVTGWYSASRGHDYYGDNTGGVEGADSHPAELVREAAQAADEAGFDFADYVSNKDCLVDVVMVVHQGAGEEDGATPTPSDIWSHHSTLVDRGVGEYLTQSACVSDPSKKVRVNRYVMVPEVLREGSLITIGTPAHEYGHALGLPDLYDTTDHSSGIGNWSLMATGCNNSVGIDGDRPAHLDAWSKYFLGWVSPKRVLKTSCKSIDLVESYPEVYQLGSGSPLSGEYFLVENRQLTGFDEALPGSGLLIWHFGGN